ncbi:MAG TPA: gamma-glutamylcyclotransferase family protein [Opitutaceae bacterium]|jgi:hypothetical protein
MSDAEPSERLFSYGTLQLEPVQLSTFGRKLAGSPDTLPGYELSLVEIDDPKVLETSGKTHHPIVKYTGRPENVVTGVVFTITLKELLNADRYEVAAYRRFAVRLGSGTMAWAYIDDRYGPPGH